MEPVLKWAGGKRQLLAEIRKIITPESLQGHRLFEPFVGGGSVFLSYEHKSVVINDYNEELMNVYEEIKTNADSLICLLKNHKEKHDKEYYYKIRNLDRTEAYAQLTNTERAARIIYLNRTCFNGLYRVNAKGQYNVPVGKYVNPDIVSEDRIREMSKYLSKNKVHMRCGDFEKSVKGARRGDTIYFDPPYDYEECGFTSYTPGAFSRADLTRMKKLCDRLIEKGCKVVVSNNDTSFVRELFDDEKYTIKTVMAKRMINCDGAKRSEVREVLIYG